MTTRQPDGHAPATSGARPPSALSQRELTPDFGPTLIERPSRLAAAVVDQLRTLIFQGQLPPATILRQEDLAGRLGVSRTPLREALRLLEAEGLLESTASGASRVVDLTGPAAEEAMEVREVIDGLVARLAAQRGLARVQVRQLGRLLDDMDRANRAGDKKAYLAANASFHLSLLKGLDHRWLDQFIPLVRVSSQATYLHLQSQTDRLLLSAIEHRDILAAIVAGQVDLAEREARAHVRNALKHWVADDHPGSQGPPAAPGSGA
ncbi:MAG: GntR family transcriptional regulator [Candidatus Dormibacteria bacterium]